MSTTLEQEINELRSQVAAFAGKAKDQAVADRLLAQLESLEKRVAQTLEVADPGASARELVLRTLATADKGKPGYMSIAALEEKCKMTKSATHHHVNELDKEGRVWIRKTHDPKSGRPHFLVYHTAAVRA